MAIAPFDKPACWQLCAILWTLPYQSFDVFAQDADTRNVISTLRDNEVGIAFGRLDKLFVHGYEHLHIAFYHHRNGTAAVDDIALDVAYQAFV